MPEEEDVVVVVATADIDAAASSLPATTFSVPLTKYERARLVAARVRELEANAAATVSLTTSSSSINTLFDIATREVAERTLDTNLKRFLPGGCTETLHLSSFPREDDQN